MCGIFGVFRRGGLVDDDRWLLRRMADAMIHRGPDGEGFHLDGQAGIGMRRLAIIDPSGGWQPLFSEDGQIALVANGEIYNFVELRRDLEARGHQFQTGSDCETIVHLYEEYGTDCVQHLRGMFAFALIDRRRRRLIIARDRMGEKPLLLAEQGDRLIFCSELTGLVGARAVPFEIDPEAIKLFYYWGFIPEPVSPVIGTRKLPAGSMLQIDLESGRREERVYWRLEDAPPIEGDPVERIREELDIVGRITMRSDVPLGVALSAGIDSSAIAMLAKRCADQPVSALSIGYEGNTLQDESRLAEAFAREIGIPFHRVEVSVDRVVENFPQMCLRRDDPVLDISGSSIFELMRGTHAHGFRVLLSGLGGDELFWGYPWHRRSVEQSENKRRMLRGEGSILDYLRMQRPPLSITGLINWMESLGGLLAGVRAWRRDARSDPNRLVFWDQIRDFQLAERRFSSFAGDAMKDCQTSAAAPFTGAMFWDNLDVSLTERLCATYLRCNGLAQTDRLSMACSVESRVPLVDYRIAEVVIGLRKVRSDREFGHKHLLRQALRDVVPEQVLQRRKRGFTPPWRTWIARLMQRYGDDMARGQVCGRGIVTAAAAEQLRSGFDGLGRIKPFALETLVLEQWAQGMASLASNASRSLDGPLELPPRNIGRSDR
jgi:asparagine synthase (glutamine-hydrolysing)